MGKKVRTMLIRLSPTAQQVRALTNNRHPVAQYPVDTHYSVRILQGQ